LQNRPRGPRLRGPNSEIARSPSRTILVARSLRIVRFALQVLPACNVRKSVVVLHESGFSTPTVLVDKSKTLCFVRLSKLGNCCQIHRGCAKPWECPLVCLGHLNCKFQRKKYASSLRAVRVALPAFRASNVRPHQQHRQCSRTTSWDSKRSVYQNVGQGRIYKKEMKYLISF
jgi:hypothetical protein